MATPLKVGLVGTGGISRRHITAYLEHPDRVKLTAVCDLDETRAQEFARKAGVEAVYTDFDKMLREADIDAVDNCTFHHQHAPLCIAAAEAGKHVIVEKPMARTVQDTALLLEVLAGPDGLDPRQQAGLHGQAYTQALTGNIQRLRIGIVEEGFGWDVSEKDVDESVREAAQAFEKLGASVKTISIPWHLDGLHIWNGIAIEGPTLLMVEGGGMGTNWKGHYTTSLLDAAARGRLTRANDLSETVKLVILLGRYMQEHYHGRYYAKAQNIARSLTAAYDAALQECDVLVMPTLPMKATRIPAPDTSREEYVDRALEMLPNTCPFDVTGHPAITIPCAVSEGLPVGMMLVGRHGDDGTVLQAADAFEKNVFAAPAPPQR